MLTNRPGGQGHRAFDHSVAPHSLPLWRPRRLICPAWFLASLVGVLVALFVRSASAHIQITYPVPREGTATPQLKSQPCGTTGLNRSTNPARITTFRPGETITVRWTETVGHPGHFRIAFLQNGNAFTDPTSYTDIQATPVLPVLKDGIADMAQTGTMYMTQVTLPQVECNNCTLQVIQVMTDKPPFSPSPPVGTGDDVYHQCADLILSYGDGGTPTPDAGRDGSAGAAGAGGATSGSGGSTGMGGSGASGSSGMGGASGSGAGGTDSTGGSGGAGGSTTTGGSTSSTTASGTSGPGGPGGASTTGGGNAAGAAGAGGGDAGCSCRLTSRGKALPGGLGVLLTFALALRRRRRLTV
jgi:hypothetical protein